MAVAILECAPQSHPFEDRNITLSEPIKIGRSVARIRPAVGNAIFDCKVLSRNHALLWYEGGKFYLQDTKSSNGTFVNNNRLSKGSEESPPKEIFSGDIIKFGVDVVENSRNVTHNCIIGKIKLYHADGVEAVDRMLVPSSPGSVRPVLPQELYQLAQYLQEALYREQVLETKLAAMQKLVMIAQEASDDGWQALIDEDRLLSRLEMLESRLLTYSKNYNDDTLRKDLIISRDDLYNYEKTAKESVRKMLEEKLEALRKVAELESSLSAVKEESGHLQDVCEAARQELELMTQKHDEQLKEAQRLQQCLDEAEKEHRDDSLRLQAEKSDLEVRLDELRVEEDKLLVKIESLQANNDFMKEQLTNMKEVLCVQHDLTAGRKVTYSAQPSQQSLEVDLVNLLDLHLLQDEGKGEEDEEMEERCEEKGQREQMSSGDLRAKLKEAQEKVDILKNELTGAKDTMAAYGDKVTVFEGELKDLRQKWQDGLVLCEQLQGELATANATLQISQQELVEAKQQVAQGQAEMDNLRVKLAEALEAVDEPRTPVLVSTAPFFSLEGASQLTLKPGTYCKGTWVLPRAVSVTWFG